MALEGSAATVHADKWYYYNTLLKLQPIAGRALNPTWSSMDRGDWESARAGEWRSVRAVERASVLPPVDDKLRRWGNVTVAEKSESICEWNWQRKSECWLSSTFSHGLDIVSAFGRQPGSQAGSESLPGSGFIAQLVLAKAAWPNIASCAASLRSWSLCCHSKVNTRIEYAFCFLLVAADGNDFSSLSVFPSLTHTHTHKYSCCLGQVDRREGAIWGLQFNCYFQRFNRFN